MISSFFHRSFVSHTRFLFSCFDSFKVPSRTPGRLRAAASTPVQGTCDAGDAPPRVPQGRLGGGPKGPSRQTVVLEVTELLRQMMQILSILAGQVEVFQINEYKHYALHATECSRESYATGVSHAGLRPNALVAYTLARPRRGSGGYRVKGPSPAARESSTNEIRDSKAVDPPNSADEKSEHK